MTTKKKAAPKKAEVPTILFKTYSVPGQTKDRINIRLVAQSHEPGNIEITVVLTTGSTHFQQTMIAGDILSLERVDGDNLMRQHPHRWEPAD